MALKRGREQSQQEREREEKEARGERRGGERRASDRKRRKEKIRRGLNLSPLLGSFWDQGSNPNDCQSKYGDSDGHSKRGESERLRSVNLPLLYLLFVIS
jgi:hypothetical protein